MYRMLQRWHDLPKGEGPMRETSIDPAQVFALLARIVVAKKAVSLGSPSLPHPRAYDPDAVASMEAISERVRIASGGEWNVFVTVAHLMAAVMEDLAVGGEADFVTLTETAPVTILRILSGDMEYYLKQTGRVLPAGLDLQIWFSKAALVFQRPSINHIAKIPARNAALAMSHSFQGGGPWVLTWPSF